MRAWEELEPAWRAAFELAWEAYAAGSIPVGAVVANGATIVARGRNRLFETTARRRGRWPDRALRMQR